MFMIYLLDTIDKGSISVYNALDLSATFDTIDHEILLKRLEATFEMSGTVLIKWFKSYICDQKCTHEIKLNEYNLSSDVP